MTWDCAFCNQANDDGIDSCQNCKAAFIESDNEYERRNKRGLRK